MKKKGFTLIELLAVIVVLAVVALITVPTVLNIIDNVRKESYRDSVYGIMESGKIYLASHIDSISEKDEIEFTCDGDKCTSTNDELSFKGSVPKSGSIYISGNGLIEIESLYNGKYYANGTNEEGIEITNDSPMTRVELADAINELKQTIASQNKEYTSEINALKNKINTLENENNTIKESATSIDEVYPVGSIYITLSNVNPSTIFPGTTWERYGQGKTLVGDDETNYITGDATKGSGGSSTVTLTSSNIPTLSVTGSTTASSTTSGNNSITPTASFTGNRVSTENTGSGYGWSHACEWRGTSTNGDHSHSGNTGVGYTDFMRVVSLAGTAATGNHTTGYSSGAYADMNSTSNFPGANHWHAFTTSTNGNHSHSSLDCFLNGISGVATHAHYYTASGSVSLSNTTHNHSVSIPQLTVNAAYTNNNQTNVNVQDPYTVVYMWKRIS